MAAEEKKEVSLSVIQKDITDSVTSRVLELQEEGALVLPKSYAVGNELKMAFFALKEVKDKNDKPAFDVCTRDSIANALLEMVVQGLSVWRKQVYFVVRGNQLSCDREYFGNLAIALRSGKVTDIPSAQCVYKDDVFEYEIINGVQRVVKHEQKLGNIDINKIVGGYCIVPKSNGTEHTEIMTITQIRQSWLQGPMKGNSGAHKNFTDQMAKRTVINRALKLIINSGDDDYLFDNQENPVHVDEKREALEEVEFTDAEVVDEETGEVVEEAEAEQPKDEKPKVEQSKKADKPNEPQMMF